MVVVVVVVVVVVALVIVVLVIIVVVVVVFVVVVIALGRRAIAHTLRKRADFCVLYPSRNAHIVTLRAMHLAPCASPCLHTHPSAPFKSLRRSSGEPAQKQRWALPVLTVLLPSLPFFHSYSLPS